MVIFTLYNNKQKQTVMEKVTLEIRAAEGGEDSKLLVGDMAAVYLKAAKNKGFTLESEH